MGSLHRCVPESSAGGFEVYYPNLAPSKGTANCRLTSEDEEYELRGSWHEDVGRGPLPWSADLHEVSEAKG